MMLGFRNAPTTRFFILCLFFGSYAISITNVTQWLRLESFAAQVLFGSQWWRPWTHQLILTSMGQLFMTLLLMYSLMPHMERIMGAAKFRKYLLMVAVLCPLLLCSYALLMSHDIFHSVPGPLAVLMALVSLSLRYIPLSGVDHFSIPLFSLQLAIPLLPDSLIHIGVGIAVSAWVSNYLKLK